MTLLLPGRHGAPSLSARAGRLDAPSVSARAAELLADRALATPFVVVDLSLVAERYDRLVAALPEARVFYAVKANPADPILRLLVERGSAFDVASPGEIDRCLSAGASPTAISYGNTIKKRADVAYAHSVGVRRYTVDSPEELAKVLEHAPGAEICVRMFHDCAGADWPLSRKFGCEAPDALRLLVEAGRAGSRTGVSFHVGSQQRSVQAWDPALEVTGRLFADAADVGYRPSFVNLGGGFPGTYHEQMPEIEEYGAGIRASLHRWFGPELPEIMAEPGRYLVADAGVLCSEVVLVSRRSPDDAKRWVYLDCGMFGGLAETMGESIRYRLLTAHDGSPTGPVALAGPTCDSADILYEKTDYELPLALTDGDRVHVLSAGAYTTTYSSVGFNGFTPLRDYYV